MSAPGYRRPTVLGCKQTIAKTFNWTELKVTTVYAYNCMINPPLGLLLDWYVFVWLVTTQLPMCNRYISLRIYVCCRQAKTMLTMTMSSASNVIHESFHPVCACASAAVRGDAITVDICTNHIPEICRYSNVLIGQITNKSKWLVGWLFFT